MPGTRPGRRDGARPALTREQVLRAAITLVERDGMTALSMRRLGEDLGVEAMSLYHHVRNKDDLLDGMLDLVAAEMATAPDSTGPDSTGPGPTSAWRHRVRARAVRVHDVLLAHPWAPALWLSRPRPGRARLRMMDDTLAELATDGLDPDRLDLAFHALQNHVVGHALQAVSLPVTAAEMPSSAAAALDELPLDGLPHLAEHIRYHVHDHPGDDAFGFVLDLLLDALDPAAGVPAAGVPGAGLPGAQTAQ